MELACLLVCISRGTGTSPEECQDNCLKNEQCVATSFANPEYKWKSSCFLFKND